MSTVALTIFIGVILAVPLVYVLELESPGAITLLIFLCTGTVGTFLAIRKSISKKRRRR
jgi:hypothetical protein